MAFTRCGRKLKLIHKDGVTPYSIEENVEKLSASGNATVDNLLIMVT